MKISRRDRIYIVIKPGNSESCFGEFTSSFENGIEHFRKAFSQLCEFLVKIRSAKMLKMEFMLGKKESITLQEKGILAES